MSVGHLDHVLIVYSLMEHVTWKSPGPMCGWVGRILHPDSCAPLSCKQWRRDQDVRRTSKRCHCRCHFNRSTFNSSVLNTYFALKTGVAKSTRVVLSQFPPNGNREHASATWLQPWRCQTGWSSQSIIQMNVQPRAYVRSSSSTWAHIKRC